jgi:hypothetical protein
MMFSALGSALARENAAARSASIFAFTSSASGGEKSGFPSREVASGFGADCNVTESMRTSGQSPRVN